MKASVTAIIATLVAIVAFFAGRSGAGKDQASNPSGSGEGTTVSSLSASASSSRKPKAKAELERRPVSFVSDHSLTVEEARALTSEERIALIKRGAMSWNSGNQIALMGGVIAALTKDEIGPATDILGGIQDRGNFQTQEVWNALWTQWGRVDPTKAVEFFARDNSGKSKSDARNMMTGWQETDPLAAFTWAKQPKNSQLEAAAAALAITRNANGDPNRMEASILALPADSPSPTEPPVIEGFPLANDFKAKPGYNQTRSACLQDYFDLVSMAGASKDAAETYNQLPSGLRDAGWPVALQRMIHQDPQAAAGWVANHASDPGRDYVVTLPLASYLASQDPAAAMTWATRLPGLDDSVELSQPHPAKTVINTWLGEDRKAASDWLRSNASEAAWARPFLKAVEE